MSGQVSRGSAGEYQADERALNITFHLYEIKVQGPLVSRSLGAVCQ